MTIQNKPNNPLTKDREYVLSYKKDEFWEWDDFALALCKKENCGNENNWFYSFRGGLNGFHARMAGAEHHYNLMHAWIPQIRTTKETEYHLATLFFQVDSAVECLVFAMNSIGYIVEREGFRDIYDTKELRRISPLDVLGNSASGKLSLEGYSKLFPKTLSLWLSKQDLFSCIFEQHDVSKHRQIIYTGSSVRNDPPKDFWNSIQVSEECKKQFRPIKEVILGNELKQPLKDRKKQNLDESTYLEDVMAEFFELMSQTGATILDDSRDNIKISQ